MMRARPSARLLVLDPEGTLLLFRFSFTHGPLAGSAYWATPGGALETGETFEDAAVRELLEETGIKAETVGASIAEQTFPLQLTNGEWVTANERFFVVRVPDRALSRDGWTAEERETMTEHRWWSLRELEATRQTVFPKVLVEILTSVGVGA